MPLPTIGPRLATLDTRKVKPPAKAVDPYYQSPAHQQWRAEVVRRAGGRCQWPGCDRVERRMFADHIVERRDGGNPLDPANGQCLCGKHHSIKTAAERAKRLARPPGGGGVESSGG